MAACGNASTDGPITPAGPSNPAPDAAPAEVIDAGVITPDAAPDAVAPAEPVSTCAVDDMVTLYPGPYPPNPYDTAVAGSACVLARHEVIIVLGCPNNTDGTPAFCQTERADIAVALQAAGYGDRFITTGGAVHNQYVEAQTLHDLLVARGVPDDHIVLETQAQHTDENIYYSAQIMIARGWQNALVVSEDAGQLIMTGLCDANCCVDLGRLTVEGFPITLDGLSVIQKIGHYVRYPWATTVSDGECTQIEMPLKAMCVNASTRKSCAGNLMLP
jgi:hypothetical protein